VQNFFAPTHPPDDLPRRSQGLTTSACGLEEYICSKNQVGDRSRVCVSRLRVHHAHMAKSIGKRNSYGDGESTRSVSTRHCCDCMNCSGLHARAHVLYEFKKEKSIYNTAVHHHVNFKASKVHTKTWRYMYVNHYSRTCTCMYKLKLAYGKFFWCRPGALAPRRCCMP
jgi:hypothetical protein